MNAPPAATHRARKESKPATYPKRSCATPRPTPTSVSHFSAASSPLPQRNAELILGIRLRKPRRYGRYNPYSLSSRAPSHRNGPRWDRRSSRWLPYDSDGCRFLWGCSLAAGGCCTPSAQKIDDVVCDMAAHPVDLQPLPADPAPMPQPLPDSGVKPASYEEPATPRKAERAPNVLKGDRLQIPDELLPGGPIPRIQLPADEKDPKRKEVLDQLYPAMPATGDNVQPATGPEGRPLNLADLQRLALSNSPHFRQAAANVEAMRGAAIQAGAYPNPTLVFKNDTAAPPAAQATSADLSIKSSRPATSCSFSAPPRRWTCATPSWHSNARRPI